jgi:hypothetical protein
MSVYVTVPYVTLFVLTFVFKPDIISMFFIYDYHNEHHLFDTVISLYL